MPTKSPRGSSLLLLFAFAAGLCSNATTALASAFSVQGASPEGVAEVGARAARADDGTAAFENPAGLAWGKGTTLSFSPIASYSALKAQGSRQPLVSPFGANFSASGALPFEGPLAGRLRVGIAGYLLPAGALRLRTNQADKPFFPYYNNRTQRLAVIPALSVRIAKWLGVGAGANVLAGVSGPATLEDGATGAPEPRIDIVANTIVAGIFGLRVDPSTNTCFSLTLRQSFGIPLRIETTANIGGVPLSTQIESREALFDPLTVVLASSFRMGRTAFELDTSYFRFSAWQGAFLAVRSSLPGVNLASRIPAGLFRDTVSLRAAATHDIDLKETVTLVFRLGAGFEPTMLKSAQQGETNLVDGDKLLLGLGMTLVLKNTFPKALRLGFGGNTQWLSSYSQEKVVCRQTPCAATTIAGPSAADPSAGVTNPGFPRLSASGSFYTFSFGVGVDL